MATTPLERLLFLQGGRCFFCRLALPKAEASIEHLQAVSGGGTNHDDNCVACCKTLNRVLGSMPLKAKIEVVLNQKGDFVCPNAAMHRGPRGRLQADAPRPKSKAAAPGPDVLMIVTRNLKQRGASRPRSEKTLRSTVQGLLKQHESQQTVDALLSLLKANGTVSIDDLGKVSYVF